jgi:PIN domain nuclease of toxin-antitoxin system
MSAVLDTHTVIWYVFTPKRLSEHALRYIRRTIDSGKPIYISAISFIETIYLIEKGRMPIEALQRLEAALKAPDSGLIVAAIDENLAAMVSQIPRDLVPDMPDRIIAATALYLELPLITRDQRIQSTGIKTIW